MGVGGDRGTIYESFAFGTLQQAVAALGKNGMHGFVVGYDGNDGVGSCGDIGQGFCRFYTQLPGDLASGWSVVVVHCCERKTFIFEMEGDVATHAADTDHSDFEVCISHVVLPG